MQLPFLVQQLALRCWRHPPLFTRLCSSVLGAAQSAHIEEARTQASSQPSSGTPPDVKQASVNPQHAAACAVGDAAIPRRLLMRDFIQQSLYHPTKGYFNRPIPVVGSVGNPINFWGIYCREEFNVFIKKRYEELQVSFLTPAELFTPWYGHIIARHMLEHRTHTLGMTNDDAETPLTVVEIGGGNGTLARDILDWLRDNRPAVYARSRYTCLEISSSLAVQQYETVVVRGGHGAHFRQEPGNAWDRSAWGGQDYQHTFVLMMEVLDNLPHDRVFRSSPSEAWQQSLVYATQTAPTMDTGPWVVEGQPVGDDELVGRCLTATYKPASLEDRMDNVFNRALDWLLGSDSPQPVVSGDVLFLPTACLSLLDLLHLMRPNHSLIAADFDMLPGVRIPGTSAPLVAEKVDGVNVDHDTILVPWGTADIFFPTDFNNLSALYRESAQHVWGPDKEGQVETSHYRQGEVMKRYREMTKTATICSFNPMVDDFLNARFFFGDSRLRHPPGYVPPPATPRLRRPGPGTPAGGSSSSNSGTGGTGKAGGSKTGRPATPRLGDGPTRVWGKRSMWSEAWDSDYQRDWSSTCSSMSSRGVIDGGVDVRVGDEQVSGRLVVPASAGGTASGLVGAVRGAVQMWGSVHRQ